MANQDSFAGVRIPRSPVYGTKGMVVSGHSMASMAGLRVLERGGNVIDAMIATSAVLCVILPHATSLGGDAFILHHSAKTGKTEGLNASGHAPNGATPEFFKDGMKSRGPLAFSIPGIVRGWEDIHKKHGSLPWKRLVEPAVRLARDGFVVTDGLARSLRSVLERMRPYPASFAQFKAVGVVVENSDGAVGIELRVMLAPPRAGLMPLHAPVVRVDYENEVVLPQ